jgi:hypothetical protein
VSTLKYTTDGTTWTDATFSSSPTGDFISIDYFHGSWIALTDTGEIWVCPIGTSSIGNFSPGTVPTSGVTKHISEESSRFVIIQDKEIYTNLATNTPWGRVNRISWTNSGVSLGATVSNVAYGSGRWVVHSGGNDRMLTSTDAVAWTTVSPIIDPQVVSSIWYRNDSWVVGSTTGVIGYSTDFISWTTVDTGIGTAIGSIEYGDGKWAVASGASIFISTDSTTWTSVVSNFGLIGISKIMYKDGTWIAGGGGNPSQYRRSTDAVTWTTISLGTANSFVGGSVGESEFVITQAYQIFRRSTDGITWTGGGSSVPYESTTVYGPEYANGYWVVSDSTGRTYISTDGGQFWQGYSSPGVALIDLIGGGSKWVAVSRLTPFDIWTAPEHFSGAPAMNKHIRSATKSLLIGENGSLWDFSNATFNRIGTEINDNLIDGYIDESDGTKYILQGDNGFYLSTDLVSWTTVSSLSSSVANGILGK